MAKATQFQPNNTDEIAPACPNSRSAAHIGLTPAATVLSGKQVRAALTALDIGPGSSLRRSSLYFAVNAEIDPDDLLQEALLRAMTTRSCPAGLGIASFIKGIMRSIASEVVAWRDRNEALLRTGSIVGLVGQSHGATEPAEVLDQGVRADVCAASLVSIAVGNPSIEKVLDGIGQGRCGKDLMAFANVTELQLASIRKTLKRRSKAEFVSLQRLDDAA